MVRCKYTLIATGVVLTLLTAGAAAWSLRAPPSAADPVAFVGQDLHPDMRTGKPTVVEFGANACASCREMKVLLSQLRQTHGERYAVLEVDLLQQRDIAQRHRIQLMPTQVFFDAQGRETGRHMGKLGFEEIVKRLELAASART